MKGHINHMNLKLQSQINLISDNFVHVKVFRAKLVLLESQVKVKILLIFHVVKNFMQKVKLNFLLHLQMK